MLVFAIFAFPLLNSVPRLVRDQAFKALEMFTKKIHAYATNMVRFFNCAGRTRSILLYQPETAANKDGEVALGSTGSVSTTLVSSAAGAAGSLAGWAISGISKKVRCGLVDSSMC